VTTRIGDVFSVSLDSGTRKYFQYVANDVTQLNSDVIRAFKKACSVDTSPGLSVVTAGEVDFYAHTMVNLGVKMGLWQKVGKVPDIGRVDVLFRNSDDYGDPKIATSSRWYVWKINEPFVYVGKLEGKQREAEIGIVLNPRDVVERLRTGKYDFVYPGY